MESRASFSDSPLLNPQTALLDAFFPGFSLISTAIYKYSKVDLSLYIPAMLIIGLVVISGRYVSTWFWEFADKHLMSTADIRVDDEMYNMVMSWVAKQSFSHQARRFVANTNLNSKMWWMFRSEDDDDEEEGNGANEEEEDNERSKKRRGRKEKKVHFTPAFGTHYFWYKGRLLTFRRTQDNFQRGFQTVSEREEVALQCFGRNPAILKTLLDECRDHFNSQDKNRTVIYRGGLKPGTTEPSWTRCVSRRSRPLSTVVLDEGVKQSLLDDMRDYLRPTTRRWYSNRGIPYRRGHLLYGPPGTGKSSLSFAIAGYFNLKIYIVSLNSLAMHEENLGTLFSQLPTQCVVLLEDIDTAGLTHTRENPQVAEAASVAINQLQGTTVLNPANPPPVTSGRISLSALLNILDGVAAVEGRILVMTTNHLEKLDDALLRPGRVDMTIKFDLASSDMIETIFRGIYATLEGDGPLKRSSGAAVSPVSLTGGQNGHIVHPTGAEATVAQDASREKETENRKEHEANLDNLSSLFVQRIPPMTFSPAEIQGYLLKHKRTPDTAVENAAEWVVKRKIERVKEKEKKEQEEKERLEKEAKKLAAKEKKKSKKGKKSKKDESDDDSGSDSGSSSD